jgi:AcrR family transcriptional regulator
MSASSVSPRRKDAERNRRAILDAARELFAECADVPMCEIAKRAGVGQATLYRNFPDRWALAAELLADEIARTQALAEEHAGDPDAFFLLLRHIVEMVTRLHVIGDLAGSDVQHTSELRERRRQLGEIIKQPLRDAKANDSVRRDLTTDDVFLIIRMLRGAVEEADGPAARAAAASRTLTLLLDGVAR